MPPRVDVSGHTRERERDPCRARAGRLLAAAKSYGTSFDDVSMEEIASVTGVPATASLHFRSKEQVLAFLLTAMLDDIATNVEGAAATADDARTRLVNVVRAQLKAMATRPATSQLLVANLGRAGKLPDIAAGIDQGLPGTSSQHLGRGRRCGRDPQHRPRSDSHRDLRSRHRRRAPRSPSCSTGSSTWTNLSTRSSCSGVGSIQPGSLADRPDSYRSALVNLVRSTARNSTCRPHREILPTADSPAASIQSLPSARGLVAER